MNKLKAIKIIVFLLTFMLIFGTLSVIGIILKRVKAPQATISKEVFLNQEKGSSISQIATSKESTFVLVKNKNKEDKILVLDKSNNVVSTVFIGKEEK